MASRNNPIWVELVQLIPIVSLALPFILQGKVDLSGAGFGFALGALLNLPIYALILQRGYVLNPILLGAALWLGVGGVAFNVPIDPIAKWLIETQAFGLFLAAFGVGVVTTFLSPHGYAGCSSDDRRWLRRSSLFLLALTLAALAWAWLFRGDVRMGGGAPFIVLNVARRVLIARGSRTPNR